MKITKKLVTLALAALMLLSLAVPAAAADSVTTKATVTKTNIKADTVYNMDGYASLLIEGVYTSERSSYIDDDGKEVEYDRDVAVVKRPQVALADKTGKLVFSYRESYNLFYYDADSGIVSLTSSGPYNSTYDYHITLDERYQDYDEMLKAARPIYYNLNGSVAFTLPDCMSGPMHNGLAVVIESSDFVDHAYVVGKTGKKVFDLPDEFAAFTAMSMTFVDREKQIGSFYEGLAACYNSIYGHAYYEDPDLPIVVGYMDSKGKMAFDLSSRRYDNSGNFYDGMAWVVKGDKCGFIDKTGKEVIAPQYEDTYPFYYGLAAVKKDGKYGFIDKTGKTVVPFAYDNSRGSGDGLLSVGNKGKYGLINTKNEVVVPLEYDTVTNYNYGVAYAIKDGYLYVITADESASTTPTTPSFGDVPASAWYAAPVAWAVEKGITNGTGANKFSPNKTCNNSEILTFLWRACGKPEAEAASFTDVAANAWYADAANWAKSKGMVSGDKLSPTEPCTRASAVMFIWQAMGKPAASEAASFTDVPANADYAAAVAWAVEKGVTNGTGADTFSPDSVCTRAQIVAFLQRAYAE